MLKPWSYILLRLKGHYFHKTFEINRQIGHISKGSTIPDNIFVCLLSRVADFIHIIVKDRSYLFFY